MAATRIALIGLSVAVASSLARQARGQIGVDRASPPVGLDLYMPVPVGTPSHAAAALAALGSRLFFDPVLSRDSSVACASCHQPARAFTDGRPVARGVGGRLGSRNTPTVLNRGYGATFAWDGGADRLESQALRAIENPAEMDLSLDSAVARLRRHPSYATEVRALGDWPSADGIGAALGQYLRSIVAGDSRFDRFVAGDRTALTREERRGLDLFQGRARCDRCHSGSLLSDEQFHNTGVAWREGAFRDDGRYAVSGRGEDRGAFKTPTLRHVAQTAPYMHDGSLATLEAVVAFYDRGGNPNPNLDHRLRPLQLSAADRAALVAFLRALSGAVREGR